MIGRGGADMQAREDMFAAQAPDFKTATLLGSTRTGADDKFDEQHSFYQLFAQLGALRAGHPALRTGAMIARSTSEPGMFAFSRIERREQVEYLIALNNSRTVPLTAAVSTSQPAGATFTRLFDSRPPDINGGESLTADAAGMARVTLAPLQFAVWRAPSPLRTATSPPQISLVTPAPGANLEFTTREVDGVIFPSRREIRAEVTGGDGVAEVTFAMSRASRPGQYELLGTDDAAPYRIFWQPPNDLAPGEAVEFIATVNDLRGHNAVAHVDGIKIAPTTIVFGIRDAKTPRIVTSAPATVSVLSGAELSLSVHAEGTGPFEYQWLRDGEEIPGATSAMYSVPHVVPTTAGRYRVLVHNLAGTSISPDTMVNVSAGRMD